MPWYSIQRGRSFTPLIEDWNAYVKPLSYYSDLLDIISQYTSVVLMASAHNGGVHRANYKCKTDVMSTVKSCQYITAMKSFLERSLPHNATVSLRLGQTPDDDIVFSSQAAIWRKVFPNFRVSQNKHFWPLQNVQSGKQIWERQFNRIKLTMRYDVASHFLFKLVLFH